MVAPRIVRRSGYSYYEKILYNNLIKRGYNENQDFKHLYPIEDENYILDFAFVNEKLDIECDGEPWHEKCRKSEEEQIRDEFLTNQGWKVLRFKFSTQNIKKDLLNALKRIDLEIKKIRGTTLP
jgi:very-short-patch-repair endonuclease